MSNTWKRAKIKIAKTNSEWLWDIIGYSIYLLSFVLLLFVWDLLPEKVPAHYNASGEVDRLGSKLELLMLPAIGGFMIILMQVFEKFPEMHNYPQRLNESNAEQFYLLSRKMINQLKNICIIIFSFILFESISVSLGWTKGFGKWFLPIIIIGTGVPIVVGLMKQKRIK